MPQSWKLDSSATMVSSLPAFWATWLTGMPMFPASNAWWGHCWFNINPMSVVVVVLPFVPVMPIHSASDTWKASSGSVIIGRPNSCARWTIGLLYGIPGFLTINSKCSSNNSTGWRPVITRIPSANNSWASLLSSNCFLSLTVTKAPNLCSKRAALTPLFASPNTSTFLLR